MNDIAIYFQKIDLGNNMYIFKPITIIRGEYSEDTNEFLTDYGNVCLDIESSIDAETEDFFGYSTTFEKLKEEYDEDYSEGALLAEYFYYYSEYIYFGYYDIETDKFNISKISRFNVEEFFLEEPEVNESVSSESLEIDKYELVLNVIKELRELDDMTEVREMIDRLVDFYSKYIGEPELESADIKENNINVEEKKEEHKENKLKDSHVKPTISINKLSKQIISLKELREEVFSSIIGQDRAVNDITREIFVNQTSSNPKNRSHILVTGPTGTGKTEIVRIISNILDLPFFEADATAYTKDGYVGKSIYSMISRLIENAGGDVKKAQNGILIIDEIDKKLSDRDHVSGTAVIQSLYKMMDRGVIEVGEGSSSLNTFLFDTSNLTIILMGACEYLYQCKLNEGKKTLGFVADSKELEVPKKDIILTKNDLYKYGVPNEFLGRIGDITSTNFFDENDLVRLLTRSDISPLLIQKEYFKETFGVELKYTAGYTSEIAKKAIQAKTNARELKPLVRESLKPAIEHFLNGESAKVLKLTKKTAIDSTKYYIE